jgi:hypothetical protein
MNSWHCWLQGIIKEGMKEEQVDLEHSHAPYRCATQQDEATQEMHPSIALSPAKWKEEAQQYRWT